MTLYEINDAIAQAIEKMLNSVDPETGEVNEEDAKALDELREAKEEKLDNIGAFIKNLDAEVTALTEEAKKLIARAESKKRTIDRLARYVADTLLADGLTRYETTRVAYSFRRSESVAILNEQDIPKKYLAKKVTFAPDKKAIKAAIEAGLKVRGAQIVEKQNLQIK